MKNAFLLLVLCATPVVYGIVTHTHTVVGAFTAIFVVVNVVSCGIGIFCDKTA